MIFLIVNNGIKTCIFVQNEELISGTTKSGTQECDIKFNAFKKIVGFQQKFAWVPMFNGHVTISFFSLLL